MVFKFEFSMGLYGLGFRGLGSGSGFWGFGFRVLRQENPGNT